ncbi:hypothetical protein BJ973_008144 [Actinoplanes tereljensis]|uniref:Uncharacterized protein n=1 Tax=Paractinoplanes tereljensis TaxID=571912 RepID=A0A919TXX5_9ACTN|nr:hypothetical protein [Actinoplanes tereljensis]GIF24665.1 hypothetical protein Ate02nite_73950 [Actinoplanes tereljensis]
MLGKWRRNKAAESDPASLEAVLPGVGAVPWAQLRSGLRKPAPDLPGLLATLASAPDGSDLTVVEADLVERLIPDGLLFQVTPFTIPFLARIAQDSEHREASLVAQTLLERIAYGDPEADELAAGHDDLHRDVGRGLTELVEFLYRLAASPEPDDRAEAVTILAPVDGRSERFRRLLAEAGGPGEDEVVTAAVRDAQEYLADVASGDRPGLPVD